MQNESEVLELATRADYTFKHNIKLGRHGWLRLTPAYSVKLVKEIILSDCTERSIILDPFSGTATTGLVAAELGIDAKLFDINPFLIWLGNTKCHSFTAEELNQLKSEFDSFIENVELNTSAWTPPIHNIERWWHPETLLIIASIRDAMSNRFGEPGLNFGYNLVWIAFSRLIIETSSAAFNHVSMSFKEDSVHYEVLHINSLFKEIFAHVVSTASTPIIGNAEIIKGDSTDLSLNVGVLFDTVITSPPYPNRMSYIRELRPYMYWTKFLNNAKDAGALDWEAIGGTWGTATSNLKAWTPVNNSLPLELYNACEDIKNSGDKNSLTMSLYVHKYFDDIYSHLQNIKPLLSNGAKLNYIVGNSTFYGVFVNTDTLLASIFSSLDYSNVSVDTIRRRNTKKGLLEFNVKAEWHK